MKHLIVARYTEDTSWINRVPKGWTVTVVQKDDGRGGQFDVPNTGREPTSFLWALARLYRFIIDSDTICCVQGDPFPHTPGFMDHLSLPVTSFKGLGGKEPLWSDGNGGPNHPGVPVAKYYERWFDVPAFPDKGVPFYSGGQFMCKGSEVRRWPRDWYEAVMKEVNKENDGTPYVMERLWPSVFDVKYLPKSPFLKEQEVKRAV